ncbi:MAG TPA: Gfo/Idh/MocA family oxidoreductase [Chloroflexota bacterium]|nr:Gfo/Idh/MocA family oxidoreductase [Chloroflexota bacterium]
MPYRAGIIACGGIAREHARAWLATPGVKLAALADSDPAGLDRFAHDFDVAPENCYTDYREMLDREDLDIVSVCSWHGQHAEMTVAAAARSPKVILCEKPMAVSLGEADAMITAAQRNGVKLAISHMRRFYTGWEQARRVVLSGEIGAPRRVWSFIRDGLLNWGTHTIDGMRFVMGDPAAEWVVGNVERKTDRHERGIRIEDSCAGVIAFANGAHAVIESDLTPYGSINFEIVGSEGILQVDENQVRVLAAGRGWRELEVPGDETFSTPFVAQARGIVDWLDGRIADAEFRNTASNGRATLEIMMAIYESARRHEQVRLPLQTRLSPLDLMVENGDLTIERPGAYDIRSFLVRGEGMSWR